METVAEKNVVIKSILGGWSLYRELNVNDLTVFNEALNGLVGVKYTPQLVSTQIVAGENYKFKCLAQPSVIEMTQYEAIIHIFKPLSGMPFITHITSF
ncbi:MAG: hypothetical protein HYR91_02420 [Flavobacteriia bacterium]|nr:hypothetical protein [Flavobacteriia bacterium]